MSSNAEQASNAGAQAMPEGALLREIGRRAPSPTQAVRVCQILNLATRENIRRVREIAKNKTTPEAENKKREVKMLIVRGKEFYLSELRKQLRAEERWLVEKGQRIIRKRITPYNTPYIMDAGQIFGIRLYDSPTNRRIGEYALQARLVTSDDIEYELMQLRKEGWPPLDIEVKDRRLSSLARAMGAAYERRAKRKCVTIILNYPIGRSRK